MIAPASTPNEFARFDSIPNKNMPSNGPPNGLITFASVAKIVSFPRINTETLSLIHI